MREIAVVGAGELGGAVAHVLAQGDIARSILLVDDNRGVASGKALDIAQAAPVEGYAAQIAGTSDIAAAVDSGYLPVMTRAPAEEPQGLLYRPEWISSRARGMCSWGASRRSSCTRTRSSRMPKAPTTAS